MARSATTRVRIVHQRSENLDLAQEYADAWLITPGLASFRLGRTIHAMQALREHVQAGHDDTISGLVAFVLANVRRISKRNVYYARRIYAQLDAAGISEEDLAGVSQKAMRFLAQLPTSELRRRRRRWLRLAAESTTASLQLAVWEHLGREQGARKHRVVAIHLSADDIEWFDELVAEESGDQEGEGLSSILRRCLMERLTHLRRLQARRSGRSRESSARTAAVRR